MSIRVTQMSYKVSTSGPWAFSSRSYMSVPSAHSICGYLEEGTDQDSRQVCLLLRQGADPGAAEQDAGYQVEPPAAAKTAQNDMDNMFQSYINNLRQQLETLGLE
ncbi:Keratin, type II cytoskeletal 8 [Plecturocebus cupreus]